MSDNGPLFDADRAKIRRDSAVQKVSGNSGTFMEDALFAVAGLVPGKYTGEDVRRLVLLQGIRPHHHNAWGALVMCAVKRGLLRNTGEMRSMRAVRSHARKTPVYERC